MDKDFFDREAQSNPFSAFLSKTAAKTPVSRETIHPGEPNGFLPFFFIELLDRFKSTLNSMKTFTHLSRDKLNDEEFRDYFYKLMNEDIQEIDSVINSLLSYIKINTPIVKSNTVHIILDEVLKKSERDLNSKKIRVIKKFEKELPETTVHEAQLRYIFNCILEYAIPYTLPNGSIGFLTKISDIPREVEEDKDLAPRDGRHVEVVIIFAGYKKQGEQVDAGFGTQPARKEEKMDLKLLLVKEIVRKNHGILKFEVNEKKPRTQISLFFPVERRRLIDYQFPNS